MYESPINIISSSNHNTNHNDNTIQHNDNINQHNDSLRLTHINVQTIRSGLRPGQII